MMGRQHIVDEHRGYFTMLLNLLDVYLDADGKPLEPWAVRVYFHFARLCGTSRNGHAEESERETARACGISSGLAHRARVRLAETGWITLEYAGPVGHETAYITLVDRQEENYAHWSKLRRKRNGDGLRSYSERKNGESGLRSPGEQLRSHSERGAHESTQSVSAKTVASSLSVKDRRKEELEDSRARAREGFENGPETVCELCGAGASGVVRLGGKTIVCADCALKART